MKIEVKVGEVQSHEVPARGDRDGFTVLSQDAYIVTEDERKKFVIRLADRGQVYKPGWYTLDGSSFSVNRFGALELGQVRLVPLKA